MPRRPLLSAAERATLMAMPDSEAELRRLVAFSAADLALIARRRGQANRLGFAVQLASLRYPGCTLASGAPMAPAVIDWIAAQAGVPASAWARYGARAETRREHFQELREHLGLASFGLTHFRTLVRTLTAAAHTESPLRLAEQAVAMLRGQRVVVPAASVIERACGEALARAARRAERALAAPLSDALRQRLDALLHLKPGSRLTWLTWLRQGPPAATARCMLEHLERLKTLQSLDLPDGIGRGMEQHTVRKLAQAGAQLPPAGYLKLEEQRRHATLLAVLLERMAAIRAEIIGLHARILADLATRARTRYGIAGALACGDDEAGVAPASLDELRLAARQFGPVHRYAPALLDLLALQARAAARTLLDAVALLRRMATTNAVNVPADAPRDFILPPWRALALGHGGSDRRLYALCVMVELNNALRRGDIRAAGAPATNVHVARGRRSPSPPPPAAGSASERYLRDRLTVLEDRLGIVKRTLPPIRDRDAFRSGRLA